MPIAVGHVRTVRHLENFCINSTIRYNCHGKVARAIDPPRFRLENTATPRKWNCLSIIVWQFALISKTASRKFEDPGVSCSVVERPRFRLITLFLVMLCTRTFCFCIHTWLQWYESILLVVFNIQYSLRFNFSFVLIICEILWKSLFQTKDD